MQEDFMSVLIDFSIFPLDKGVSLSPYVARALTIISDSGLPYMLGPMGTTVEGEWEELLTIVSRCFKDLKKDCGRINMTIKVDYRKSGSNRIDEKVKSVEGKQALQANP
jgi:uncharacterized protein (TIGR00106 family)